MKTNQHYCYEYFVNNIKQAVAPVTGKKFLPAQKGIFSITPQEEVHS